MNALNEQHAANLDRSRLTILCFQNVYVIELLKEYGFNDTHKIEIVDQVIKITKI
jgi:hypothetical protein